jgi:short-subunit dehydrogenase
MASTGICPVISIAKAAERFAPSIAPYIPDRLGKIPVIAAAAALTGLLLAEAWKYKKSQQRLAQLKESVVVITGASSGIGAALARSLALEVGCKKVILLARSAKPLTEALARINAAAGRHVAYAYTVDGGDGVAVDSVVARILAEHGEVNCLVNCAGAGRYVELWSMPRQEIMTALDAPFLSATYFTRAILPGMLSRNAGTVIMVQSPASRTPFPGSTMYSAARFALRGLTASLQADLHGTNVVVQVRCKSYCLY